LLFLASCPAFDYTSECVPSLGYESACISPTNTPKYTLYSYSQPDRFNATVTLMEAVEGELANQKAVFEMAFLHTFQTRMRKKRTK